MKILILTQIVDKNDTFLGFFHRWVSEFSKHFEKTTVICLKKGKSDLPNEIKVLSLGKEAKKSRLRRLRYVINFFKYIWKERKNYDAVFVHMNQEYVLLGGIFWKILGKKIYMWRNHHAGSFLTDIAASFCAKVFCTSKYSYTAKYKKTVLMPVGIDTDLFKEDKTVSRQDGSILYIGRISPVKKIHILIEAVKILKESGVTCSLDVAGDYMPEDKKYFEQLIRSVSDYNLNECVKFHEGLSYDKISKIYNSHEFFVNLSSNGMYDKTIFEAMSCGCLVLASNLNLKGKISDMFLFKENNAADLAGKVVALVGLRYDDKKIHVENLKKFVKENHSLELLGESLRKELSA